MRDRYNNESVEGPADSNREAKLKRRLLLAAEVTLVLVIVGLIVAMWLPGWIGPHSAAGVRPQ